MSFHNIFKRVFVLNYIAIYIFKLFAKHPSDKLFVNVPEVIMDIQ